MRLGAAGLLAALCCTAVPLAVIAPAAATSPAPLAQSTGRFLDGAVGGRPIQQIVDLADARATNPGTGTDQNPLDVTALTSVHVALTGSLRLPSIRGISVGAVNQVAAAYANGSSYGAAGAVASSGAVVIGSDNSAPTTATIDLIASGRAAGAVPAPGGGSATPLSSLRLEVGSVSAVARTPSIADAERGAQPSTQYAIAGLRIHATSPLLASVLGSLTTPVHSAIATLRKVANGLGAPIPASCPLATEAIPDVSVGSGAVLIDTATGDMTIDLGALLDVVTGGTGNLDRLPPNTDLIKAVLGWFTGATGLVKQFVDSIGPQVIDALHASIDACAPAALVGLVDPAFDNPAITAARKALVAQIDALLGQGRNPLAPLGDALGQLVGIGVNVQPNGPPGTFTSSLGASADQARPQVSGQTIVRALEVHIAGRPRTSIGLANAAAGPRAYVGLGTPVSTRQGPAELPTAVPAGAAAPRPAATISALPLALLAGGLALSGALSLGRIRLRRLR